MKRKEMISVSIIRRQMIGEDKRGKKRKKGKIEDRRKKKEKRKKEKKRK